MVLKMPNGDDADKKPAKGGKRRRKRIANEPELQRSYRVCTEGSQESILWRKSAEVGKIPRTLCNRKKVGKIEAEACRIMYRCWRRCPEWRCKHRSREFGGCCVDSAGKKAKKIEECIRRQLDEDKAGEQLAMRNFEGAHLRAVHSKTFAAGGSYLAGKKGFCPSVKNP